MKDNENLSKNELTQISVCQYLISQNSYISQKEIRDSMQQHGFTHISQATISRLLKYLGVIKVRNARGNKVYSLAQPQQNFCVACSLADMVISVEHNNTFILVRTLAACANYVATTLQQKMLDDILGIVSSNDILWITPADIQQTASLCLQVESFLKTQTHML